jgi:hypothetical protein
MTVWYLSSCVSEASCQGRACLRFTLVELAGRVHAEGTLDSGVLPVDVSRRYEPPCCYVGKKHFVSFLASHAAPAKRFYCP